jgi:hypothetical protein
MADYFDTMLFEHAVKGSAGKISKASSFGNVAAGLLEIPNDNIFLSPNKLQFSFGLK